MLVDILRTKVISSLEEIPTGTRVHAFMQGSLAKDAAILLHKMNERSSIFIICQNVKKGYTPLNCLGYRYGWQVGKGTMENMHRECTVVFEYIPELEEYKKDDIERSFITVSEEVSEERRKIIQKIAEKKAEEAKKLELEKIKSNCSTFVPNVLKFLKKNKYDGDKDALIFMYEYEELSIDSEQDYFRLLGYNTQGSYSYNYYKELNGVDKLTYACILFARFCNSFDEYSELETIAGRKRSVIDIWRHIKRTHPEITIFQVMESLYKIANEKSISKHGAWMCSTVSRMVFHPGGHSSSNLIDSKQEDEFKNYYILWENCTELHKKYLEEQETSTLKEEITA